MMKRSKLEVGAFVSLKGEEKKNILLIRIKTLLTFKKKCPRNVKRSLKTNNKYRRILERQVKKCL